MLVLILEQQTLGIAVWDITQQKVIILGDGQQQLLTPSLLGWDSKREEWVVGNEAKKLGPQEAANVVYSIKRYIGRQFNDPVVKANRQDLDYKLVPGDGSDQLRDILVEFPHMEHNKEIIHLSAPEISARVLMKLRQDAAHALQVPLDEIHYAVVTVPAYFNVLQRKATIEAGRLAGLEVVDILNEPTAAALAYSDTILQPDERRILIYDLGGGTFDISLLEVRRDENGYTFYTVVVDGDTHLGGDTVDLNIVKLLMSEIERQYNVSVLADDNITRERLRRVAEQAKIDLSSPECDTVTITLSDLDLGERSAFDAVLQLTQTQIEQCIQPVLQKTLRITERAVRDIAGFTWEQINEVILVGGQTLMPTIQQGVATLTGHTPKVNDRPQLAVALGAGEYAHILSRGQEEFHKNALINVIALPLGIQLEKNTFKPLVPANVVLPYTSERYPVTTTRDQQGTIEVRVLQGIRDATRVDQCTYIETLKMEVPPAPAGIPKFEVQFEVQTDGTMKVIVRDIQRDRTEILDIVENRRILIWRDQIKEK